MKSLRLALSVIISSLLLGAIVACQPQFQPGTIVDDLGREVNIDKVPQRIVSHVPSITETLFALGLGEKVVGDSEYCDYPEAAKAVTKIGGFYDPSLEKIAELEPDMVFTNGAVESLMPQLDSLGITCIVLKPNDIDGILSNIELLGKVAGAEKSAEKLIEDMKGRIAYVTERAEGAVRPPVFYTFAVTDLNNPWTAGLGTFVDSLITMAGGENIGAKAPTSWAQFSIEEVVNSDPEIIVINAKHGTAATSAEEIKRHPAWSETTAVKEGRIYLIDGDIVERSGPRIVQGLEELARIIHPELFE